MRSVLIVAIVAIVAIVVLSLRFFYSAGVTYLVLPPRYIDGRDKDVEFQFLVPNNGSRTVRIDRVEYSCACSRGNFDKTDILPGGLCPLRVVTSVPTVSGTVGVSAAVFLSDGRKVVCRGSSSWYKKIEIKGLNGIIELRRGEDFKRPFALKVVSFESDLPSQPNILADSSDVEVKVLGFVDTRPSQFVLERTFDCELIVKRGAVNGVANICAAIPGGNVSERVAWATAAELKCSPSTIYLGDLAKCSEVETRIIKVLQLNDQEARVVGVSCDCQYAKFETRNGEVVVIVDVAGIRTLSLDLVSTIQISAVNELGVNQIVVPLTGFCRSVK